MAGRGWPGTELLGIQAAWGGREMKPQQGTPNGGENFPHLYLREDEGGKTEGVNIMRFRKNKSALQHLSLNHFVYLLFFSVSSHLAELLHCRNIRSGFNKHVTFSGNSPLSICLLVMEIKL